MILLLLCALQIDTQIQQREDALRQMDPMIDSETQALQIVSGKLEKVAKKHYHLLIRRFRVRVLPIYGPVFSQ